MQNNGEFIKDTESSSDDNIDKLIDTPCEIIEDARIRLYNARNRLTKANNAIDKENYDIAAQELVNTFMLLLQLENELDHDHQ